MKTIRFLFTPALMGILFIVLAVAMAAATFIENDFGPESARALVYNTRWFELIFLLLVVNLAGQIVTFRLYRKEKLTVMLFHAAFIVMVIGAAITRYTGYDGMMHIREGETTSVTYSSGKEVRIEVNDRDGRQMNSHAAPVDLTGGRTDRFKETFRAGDKEITFKLERFISGAVRNVEETPDGVPVAAFLVTPDMVSSQTVVLKQGETGMIGEMSIGLDTEADIRVISDHRAFFVRSVMEIRSTSMQDMHTMTFAPDTLIALTKGTVYTVGGYRIMPQQLTMSGTVVPATDRVSESPEGALECTLAGAGYERKIYLWTDEAQGGSVWQGGMDGMTVKASYGSRTRQLPDRKSVV